MYSQPCWKWYQSPELNINRPTGPWAMAVPTTPFPQSPPLVHNEFVCFVILPGCLAPLAQLQPLRWVNMKNSQTCCSVWGSWLTTRAVLPQCCIKDRIQAGTCIYTYTSGFCSRLCFLSFPIVTINLENSIQHLSESKNIFLQREICLTSE